MPTSPPSPPTLDSTVSRPMRGNLKQVEPAIVYKTKADYYDKVPVTLSADKTTIISYPAPSDLYRDGQLAYPTRLAKGYLLDNRGIGKNVAFTNYTYEVYAKLPKAPSEKELLNSIIDDTPLLYWVNLGPRIYFFKDEVGEINDIIEGDFKDYKQVQKKREK